MTGQRAVMREARRAPPTLLRIDSMAGLSAGALVLLLSSPLSALYEISQSLIVGMGIANVVYGAYSGALARRATRPRGLVVLLIAANAAWAVLCVVAAVVLAPEASRLGIALLLFEGAFVGTLALLEWRNIESLL